MPKLPVFYHVPKCAGTYVCDWLLLSFRYYRQTRTSWAEKYVPGKETIKLLQITKENHVIAKLLVGDPEHLIENSPDLSTVKKPEYFVDLNSRELKKILSSCPLFALIIGAAGFKLRDTLLQLFKGIKLHQFLLLREPFEREQSIFNYLTSDKSVHEPTHAALKYSTFEDYLRSKQLADSWLIKNLLALDDACEITEAHYTETLNLLNADFYVYTVNEADSALQKTLSSCYNIDLNDVKARISDAIEKNKTIQKKLDFSTLSQKTRRIFEKRTTWDQKLYKHYSKKYDRSR